MPVEELKALMVSPKVVAANKQGEIKRGKIFDQTPDDFSLRISRDLKVASMEGIMVIWETKQRAELEAKLLVSPSGKVPKPLHVREREKKSLTTTIVFLCVFSRSYR